MRDSVKAIVKRIRDFDDLVDLESAFYRHDYERLRLISGVSKNAPVMSLVAKALDELEAKFGLIEEESDGNQ